MRIIQAYEGSPSKEIKEYMDNIISACKEKQVEHYLQSCFSNSVDRSKGLRNASDLFRFEYLIKNPYSVWIDADVSIGQNGWFSFPDNGKPYFADMYGIPDVWVMAPMGNNGLIEQVYNLVIKMEYKLFSQEACRILNTMRDKINLIPNGYFIHHSYHNKGKQHE